VQAEAANHRELLRSRVVVVSVTGEVVLLSAAGVDREDVPFVVELRDGGPGVMVTR
jgi:hypothetical protein